MTKEILDKINFQSESQDRSFAYEQSSGFLRNDAGQYLLFRAESPGDIPSARSHGDIDDSQTASYGPGLYTGNTPEAVAPYIWTRPNNVINAYATPPLESDEVYNHDARSGIEAAGSHLGLLSKRRKLGWQAAVNLFDTLHGDSRLATLDAGFDIRVGQKIMSKTEHVIDPRWGIWRQQPDDLTHIGTAHADSRPYGWAVRLANGVYRK